jgi:hypothetical protein
MSNSWQYTTDGTPITTTALTQMKTAAGDNLLGLRHYLTGLQYQNTNATATLVQILDGSSVIWEGNAPASMAQPAVISFTTPLRGSPNTNINIQAGTTGANLLVNAQGFYSI